VHRLPMKGMRILQTTEVVKVGFKMIASMKKIFRTTFALAAIAAFVSCAEEINNPATSGQNNAGDPSSVELVSMTFSTSADEEIDVKTTYSGRKVYWEETDKISVFSMGETITESDFTVTKLTEDKTGARFEGLADPNASTYYAVYPYSETNACDADGKLTVSIPSVQTAVVSGFMSGSNTSVAYSEEVAEGNLLKFKNISALLCITFKTDADAAATKSVTIKAKKNETEYWGITGKGKVSFDADMTPVIEEGDVEYVTLTAPVGGFVEDKSYFIPVYAVGDIAGIEVIYLGQDDKQYVKTRSVAATLERNVLFNLSGIPDPYLPEVIELTVDFTEPCPFTEGAYLPVADQTTTLEKYTYIYTYKMGEITFEKELKFGFRKYDDHEMYYEYDAEKGGLSSPNVCTNNKGIVIQFPGIAGRYLQSGVFSGTSGTANKMGRIGKKISETKTPLGRSFTFPIMTTTEGVTSVYLEPELGFAYYYIQRYNNMVVKNLVLRYTKEKPTVAE